MAQANLNLGFFQDTKVIDGVHTRATAGYGIFMTNTSIQHHGGVAIFYQHLPHFQVKALQQHGPNLLIFQIASEGRCWLIVRCNLSPDDTATIERTVTVIVQHPHGGVLLVYGHFNTNLAEPEGERHVEEIVVAIETSGMEYMSTHFLPCCKYWVCGMGGRGSCAATGGRCIPGQTTLWERTTICSGT